MVFVNAVLQSKRNKLQEKKKGKKSSKFSRLHLTEMSFRPTVMCRGGPNDSDANRETWWKCHQAVTRHHGALLVLTPPPSQSSSPSVSYSPAIPRAVCDGGDDDATLCGNDVDSLAKMQADGHPIFIRNSASVHTKAHIVHSIFHCDNYAVLRLFSIQSDGTLFVWFE